jgi:hypothetical protein
MSADKQNRSLLLRGEFIIYLYPPILIAGFYLLFFLLTSVMGNKEGYLFGMILYWLAAWFLPFYGLAEQTENYCFALRG